MTVRAKSKRRLSLLIVAGLGLFAASATGTAAISAFAADHHDDQHGNDYRNGRGRGDGGCCWTGGYYSAPPVVYAPYYAPPPVVYGPGVYLPGVNINIR
jgi:hypothetical protein